KPVPAPQDSGRRDHALVGLRARRTLCRQPAVAGRRRSLAEEGDGVMGDDVRIRRVSVEFLRAGPAHNQLLWPYPQYLAVCNAAGAAVVTVPYEHRVFERRLKELRYETGDQSDRLSMLHEIGRDMGRILEAVPGFTGALASEASGATLVHVRLTLS